MRNGLDYLNYQQYERALKFLREAEANQKELTAPEIAALKQGIERAAERDARGRGRGHLLRAQRAVETPQWIHRRPAGDGRRATLGPGRPVDPHEGAIRRRDIPPASRRPRASRSG